MGIGLIKSKSSLFIQEEVTEGVHVNPSAASDAVEVLEDGLEFSSSREKIERNTLTSTVEPVAPRLGMKTVSGKIGLEYKASSTEGAAPPSDRLMKSLLGGKRQNTTTVTSKVTAHTSTNIKIEDADISKFKVGDIVLVKEAGKYEVRPISVVTTTIGAASITFPFALDNGAPSNTVLLSKFTTYFADDAWTTLSADYYEGGEIRDSMSGMRAISASVDGWSTGKTANLQFALEGIEYAQTVATPAYTPDFSADALPPVLLDACAYLGGVEIDYNEFKLSIENTKSDMLSACQASGKVGTRITGLKVGGSINPYKNDNDVVRYTNFEAGATTSLFVFAYNPKDPAVTGEGRQFMAIWMPNIKISELKSGDQDGIITDEISFDAFRNAGNDTVFMGFI